MTSPIPKSAPTKREALRQLLADGRWHHMSECRLAGGWRFGARLLELRQGLGGPKLQTEHRSISGSDNEFEYRAVFEAHAQLPLTAPKLSQGARIAALEATIADLRRQLATHQTAEAST
jgi:hypothetical protein